MGHDPINDLLSDQAFSYANWINRWVRKIHGAADWPDLALIDSFAPVAHYVPFKPAGKDWIARVFKVYLNDPSVTDGIGFDTAFRIDGNGIFVGYEHGSNVWIKYLPQAPEFTADPWNATTHYAKDQLTYSTVTGECNRSRTNNNLGHDPSGTASPLPLATQITQEAVPADPGTPATPKIMKVTLERLGRFAALPDPPPNLSKFTIKVKNAVGTEIASEVVIANGIITKATIASTLVTQLHADPDLATFTITSSGKTVTLQDASDFTLTATYTSPEGLLYPMIIAQLQAYLPAIPPTPGVPQIAVVTITDSQVASGTIFSIGFVDATGTEHSFSYMADVTDSAAQVIQGLAASLADAALSDEVLAMVQLSVNLTAGTMTFTTDERAAIDATYAAISPFWLYVAFPFDWVDLVVRGAYAEALREDGQTDKAQQEEQMVLVDLAFKRDSLTRSQFDLLTDQSIPASRYRLPQGPGPMGATK